MKNLKVFGIIAFMLFVSVLCAQDNSNLNKTPEERAKNQAIAITKACSLNVEQQQKVEQIILNSIIKLNDLRKTKPTQRGEKMKEIQVIKDNQTAEIKVIMTPEQFVKYQELVEKQKQKLKEKLENRREAMNQSE